MDDARIFPRALYDYEFGKSDWKNVVPCILQPLEQSTSDILSAARKTGFCPIAEIPPKYQTYLASDGL